MRNEGVVDLVQSICDEHSAEIIEGRVYPGIRKCAR